MSARRAEVSQVSFCTVHLAFTSWAQTVRVRRLGAGPRRRRRAKTGRPAPGGAGKTLRPGSGARLKKAAAHPFQCWLAFPGTAGVPRPVRAAERCGRRGR